MAEDVYASPTNATLPYVVTQDYSIYATVSLYYNYNISSNVVFPKLGPILFTQDWVPSCFPKTGSHLVYPRLGLMGDFSLNAELATTL